MSSNTVNENDYDSPGYEFLRLHRNMMNLYYKLVALEYQRDFCPTYKCPSINKYYFSLAQTNSFEQQYLFTSLCAWLIRDKCQMNFEIELDDMGLSFSAILEALRVLHEDSQSLRFDAKFQIRLEQGYGPEVVYALSCLADRALELALEHDPQLGSGADIRFHNKQHDQTRPANSITIGQPIAGGTLTTRSLGKYFIEDSSLILDHDQSTTNDDDERQDKRRDSLLGMTGIADANNNSGTSNNQTSSQSGETQIEAALKSAVAGDDWFQQVDKISSLLVLPTPSDKQRVEDWRGALQIVSESRVSIEQFLRRSKSMIGVIENRISRQLQVVATREKFLQTNLRTQLEGFLAVWREHSAQTQLNERLTAGVNAKTDLFENYNARLKLLANDIERRTRELNDGSQLRELERLIKRLDKQSGELDARQGLLMAAHCRH